MSDFIQGPLEGQDLAEIAVEIHDAELAIALRDLATDDGNNYAIHEDPADTPEGDIRILPAPAVPPAGSSKICDGTLTIGGQEIDVTAFRLAD
jgi:hypothetical protein